MSGDKQRRRFRRWQDRVAPSTRELGSLVDEGLTPMLVGNGFNFVDLHLKQKEWPTEPYELHLEREIAGETDAVTFAFDRYGRPRLQVRGSRRKSASPHDFVRSCNLVARSRQFTHWWGAPFWLPNSLWGRWFSIATVSAINRRLSGMIAFLESGQRSGAISKAFDAVWLAQGTS